LIAINFYELTATFFEAINPSYIAPKPSNVIFNVYSYQWAGIIVMMMVYPLLFVKKIEKLLKFLTFTIYLDYTLFSPNLSKVAGAFALSFIVHPIISPYLKKNLNQEKNGRDLFLGYVATAFIYAIVGIFGAFACGKVAK
jgi:uncharacterized membrane protein YkvI